MKRLTPLITALLSLALNAIEFTGKVGGDTNTVLREGKGWECNM